MSWIQYNGLVEIREEGIKVDLKSKKELGAIIRQARQKQKQTQSSLAEQCSISRTYLADIESGRYSPSAEVLINLFNTLGLDLNLTKNVVNTDKK